MDLYKPRLASFLRIRTIGNWRIKVYAISQNERFSSHHVLENTLNKVPKWLQDSDYNFTDYGIACIIIHEGREGIFSILNWWVDENMLRNQVFLTPSVESSEFISLSDSSLTFCVWDLG